MFNINFFNNYNTIVNINGYLINPASPLMENIFLLHENVITILITISGLVFWLLLQIIDNFFYFNNFSLRRKLNNAYLSLDKFLIYTYSSILERKRLIKNDFFLESFWTLTPGVILIYLSAPSFFMLYIAEESIEPLLTIKVSSFQWYWGCDYIDTSSVWYEIKVLTVEVDFYNVEYYIEPTEYLKIIEGQNRLLETDNLIILPTKIHIRLIITSMDTLHSFTIPSLGIKLDSIPGRLNKIDLVIFRVGLYYGQCSEICGVGHGFMPITVYGISYMNFLIGEF